MSDTRLYGGGFETAFPTIAKVLPSFEHIIQRNEPTYYGIDFLIADLIGLPAPQPSLAHWMHGWNDPKIANVPDSLLGVGGPDDRILVGSQEHADVLLRGGFKDVHPVGLPFIYADQKQIDRIPRSLLVMPPHSLGNTRHDHWPFEKYAEYIAERSKDFKAVAVCINPSCLDRGFWYPQFEKLGIPWVVGAAGHDRNALKRMQILMRSFEFMTTNSIGSHVAYGAYCNMKVSISGPYSGPKVDSFEGTDYYKGREENLKALCAGYEESSVKERYPWFFVSPKDATLQVQWGENAIGASCRRSPQEIARLLGWNLDTSKNFRSSLEGLKGWFNKRL